MIHARRRLVRTLALAAGAAAATALAQTNPRQSPSRSVVPTRPPGSDDAAKGLTRLVADPIVAIDRELPSLRVDLALAPDQVPAFDAFARLVRDAAEAERTRARDHAALRRPEDREAPSPAAATVFERIADDDARRAEATRQAAEKLGALQKLLTPDQRRQLDVRILESVRDPLGTS